ncbi:MAG: acyltransferase [Xanthobacteraceae bacterium]
MTLIGRQNTASAGTSVLVPIQWLRAVAALMVVVHHALYYVNAAHGLGPEADRRLFGFSSWTFGIHIFFLISGFIMINSASGFGQPGAGLRFLKRRLIRIVPLYWLVTTAAVVAALAMPSALPISGDKLSYILGSYLFVPVLRTEGDLRPILGQGWTLDYEMFFYILFALSMFLPRRTAVLALSVVFPVLAWLGRDLTVASPILFTWTDGLILEFLFGVYVGFAYRAGWRLPNWAAYTAISAGAVLVALNIHGPTALIAGVPAMLIVAGFTLGPQPSELAAGGWLARIGDASYSLYLTHTIVLRPAWRLWTVAGGADWPTVLFVLFCIVTSVSISIAVYRLVEWPLTRYLQGLWLGTGTPIRSYTQPL